MSDTPTLTLPEVGEQEVPTLTLPEVGEQAQATITLPEVGEQEVPTLTLPEVGEQSAPEIKYVYEPLRKPEDYDADTLGMPRKELIALIDELRGLGPEDFETEEEYKEYKKEWEAQEGARDARVSDLSTPALLVLATETAVQLTEHHGGYGYGFVGQRPVLEPRGDIKEGYTRLGHVGWWKDTSFFPTTSGIGRAWDIDKDLDWYQGEPTQMDVDLGYAQVMDGDEPELEHFPQLHHTILTYGPQIVWKGVDGKHKGLKLRFSGDERKEDLEKATEYQDRISTLLYPLSLIYEATEARHKAVVEKYVGKMPETAEETEALFQIVQEKASAEEKEFLIYAEGYFEVMGTVFPDYQENLAYNVELMEELDEASWLFDREDRVREVTSSILGKVAGAHRKSPKMGGDPIAVPDWLQVVLPYSDIDLGTTPVSGGTSGGGASLLRHAAREGKTLTQDYLLFPDFHIAPFALDAGVRQATPRITDKGSDFSVGAGISIGRAYSDLTGISWATAEENALSYVPPWSPYRAELERRLGTSNVGGITKRKSEGLDWERAFSDAEYYEELLEDAAKNLHPDAVHQIIKYKKAAGAFLAFESSRARSVEYSLDTQRLVTENVVRDTPGPMEKVARRWAKEVVFYEEVLRYSKQRTFKAVDTVSGYMGLPPEAAAEIILSRRVYATNKGDELAFEYKATHNAIWTHEMDKIAFFFGFRGPEPKRENFDTEEEYAAYMKDWVGLQGAMDSVPRDLTAQGFGGDTQYGKEGAAFALPDWAREGNADLPTVRYSWKDSKGEVQALGSADPHEYLLAYIKNIAEQRAHQVIRQDLVVENGFIFVEEVSPEERAEKAEDALGWFAPVYQIFVPHSEKVTFTRHETADGTIITTPSKTFEKWTVADYTMQVFNGPAAYMGAAGVELWEQGVVDDYSHFVVDDRGDFQWQNLLTVVPTAGMTAQSTRRHAVRRTDTLDSIADEYYGPGNPAGRLWILEQMERFDVEADQALKSVAGTELEIVVHGLDVFAFKTLPILAGKDLDEEDERDSQLLINMSERFKHEFYTDQLMDMAAWGADADVLSMYSWGGQDEMLWGTVDKSTQSLLLGLPLTAGGVSLDIIGPEPFTMSIATVGGSIKLWKAVTLRHQKLSLIRQFESAIKESSTYDQIIKRVGEISPGADHYARMRVAHGMGVDENVAAQLAHQTTQLEKQQAALARATAELEELTVEAEKTAAKARIASVEENVAELEVQQLASAKELLQGQLDALKKADVVDVIRTHKRDLEAAEIAGGRATSAKKEVDAFEASPSWKKHEERLEEIQVALLTANDTERVAARSVAVAREQRSAVKRALNVEKRDLIAEIARIDAAYQETVLAIEARLAPKPFPTSDWASRADRVGIRVDMQVAPDSMKSWTQRVRRAEKKQGVFGTPAPLTRTAEEMAAAEKTRNKTLKGLKTQRLKEAKDAWKKERQPAVDAERKLRQDIRSMGKGVKKPDPPPEIRKVLREVEEAEKASKAAVKKTKEVRAEAREYTKKGGKGYKATKAHEKLLLNLERYLKAEAALKSASFARVAALAPGLKMGVLSRQGAIDALEQTQANLFERLAAADEQLLVAGQKYKQLVTNRKTARLTAGEADKALDRLIGKTDDVAALAEKARQTTERLEVWRSTFLSIAKELEQGNKLLKILPDESPRFVDLLAKGTVDIDKKTSARRIDPALLRTSLEDKFGADALAYFFSRETSLSKPLKDLLENTEVVSVSADQVTALQQLQEGLLRAREASHKHADALATVRSIAQAKGDLDMMRVSYTSSSSTRRAGNFFLGVIGYRPDFWPYQINKIKRSWNPIKNRIGATSDEIYQVLKAADFEAALINEDMRLIARAAHGGHGIVTGGASGVLIETVLKARKVSNSKKAADLYFDLVDGDVKVLKLRPAAVAERVDIIEGLEAELKTLQEELVEVERKIAIEQRIPASTLNRTELDVEGRLIAEAEEELGEAIRHQNSIVAKIDSLVTSIHLEASALKKQARLADEKWAAFSSADKTKLESVWHHFEAAKTARSQGDMVAYRSRMLAAAQDSGLFSPKRLRQVRTRIEGKELTLTQKELGQLHTEYLRIDSLKNDGKRLTERASFLKRGLADEAHPHFATYSTLNGLHGAAAEATLQIEKTIAAAEVRLDRLAAKHLPDDFKARLASRGEANRIDFELRQAKGQQARLSEDIKGLKARRTELEELIESKAIESVENVRAAERVRAPVEQEWQAAAMIDDQDAMWAAQQRLKALDETHPIEVHRRKRDLFAVEEAGVWKPNRTDTNPYVRELARVEEQRLDLIVEYEALGKGQARLRNDRFWAERDGALYAPGSMKYERLQNRRKAIQGDTDRIAAKLREHSALPSHQEIVRYAAASEEGLRLEAAFGQMILARNSWESAYEYLMRAQGELDLRALILNNTIEVNKARVEKLINKAFPPKKQAKPLTPEEAAKTQDVVEDIFDILLQSSKEDGLQFLAEALEVVDLSQKAARKIPTVTQNVARARAYADLLDEPAWGKAQVAAQRGNNPAAFFYATNIEKLIEAERRLSAVTEEFRKARAAYQEKKTRLADGSEHLPLSDRDYTKVVTKKNIPISVGGRGSREGKLKAPRTTVSNVGRQVAWDAAVHQWRVVDMSGLDSRILAAEARKGSFRSNLKLENVSESFLGISRMWVPRSIHLTDLQTSQLLTAAKEVIDLDSVHSFKLFSDEMKKRTYGILHETSAAPPKHLRKTGASLLEEEHSIAMGAYNVMRAAAVKRTNDRLVRMMGGIVTEDQAKAMNSLFSKGAGIKDMPAGSWHDAIEGLNRFGTPLTEAYTRRAGGLGEVTGRLTMSGETELGQKIFMREDMIEAIEGVFTDATKRADRFYRTDLAESGLRATAMKWTGDTYKAWKMSVTSGYLLPRPGYWINNIVGDFAQMFFTVGLAKSTKLSFQNLPNNVPVLGRHYADMVSTMSHNVSGKPVLGTLTNAMFNPNLTKVWNRMPGAVTFKGGQTASYETLYRWALQDGILDSIIQEEFLMLIDRTVSANNNAIKNTWDSFISMKDHWQEDLLMFADFAQKRQRMALYLDLLQDGYSRAEARRLTLDALYDWRHSLSKWEATQLTKASSFWRFWKNMMRQTSRVLMDPLTKPGITMKKSLTGAAPGQRVRQAMFLKEKIPELLIWEEEALVTFQQGEEELRALAKHFMPEYLYDYLYYTSSSLNTQEKEWFGSPQAGPLGLVNDIVPGRSPIKDSDSPHYDRDYSLTHSYTVGPKPGTIEGINMWVTGLTWLYGAGWVGAHMMNPEWEGDSPFTPDYESRFVLQPLLSVFGGPYGQWPIEGYAAVRGVEIPYSSYGRFQHHGNTTSLNPGEAWWLSSWGVDIAQEQDVKGQDPYFETAGRYRTDNWVATTLMRNVPGLMQVPTLVNQTYYQNPDWEKSYSEGFWTAVEQANMVPWRRKFTDPRMSVSRAQYAIGRRLLDREEALQLDRDKVFGELTRQEQEAQHKENLERLADPPPELAPLPDDIWEILPSGEE